MGDDGGRLVGALRLGAVAGRYRAGHRADPPVPGVAPRGRVRGACFGHRPWPRGRWLGLSLMVPVLLRRLAGAAVLVRLVPDLHNVKRNPSKTCCRIAATPSLFAIVATVAGGVAKRFSAASSCTGSSSISAAAEHRRAGLQRRSSGSATSIRDGMRRLRVATLGAIWGVFSTRRSIIAPMVSHAGFHLAQLIKYWPCANETWTRIRARARADSRPVPSGGADGA